VHARAEIVNCGKSEQFGRKRPVLSLRGVVVHLAAEQSGAFSARTRRCIHAAEYLLKKVEGHRASIRVIRGAQ